jgi:hypothetical protein
VHHARAGRPVAGQHERGRPFAYGIGVSGSSSTEGAGLASVVGLIKRLLEVIEERSVVDGQGQERRIDDDTE